MSKKPDNVLRNTLECVGVVLAHCGTARLELKASALNRNLCIGNHGSRGYIQVACVSEYFVHF